MGKFVTKRLVQFIVVLCVASILIFLLVRMNNADPVAVILGGKQTTPDVIAAIRTKFNLDKPLIQQYLIWITGMLHGDFGMSFKYQAGVAGLLEERIPITLGLVVISSVISLVIAIPLGILCALKKHTAVDRIGSVLTLILAGMPAFLTSIIAVVIISKVNPSYPFTGSYSNFAEYIRRLALPSVALSTVMLALAMRVMRSNMIEQRSAPYTTTAVAKGIKDSRIIWKHNVKNALIPFIAVISLQIGNTVVGAVLVEEVFSLPGLGTFLVDSIQSSDYAVVQCITMLLVFIFMVISTVADIIYAAIDPRIRLK